MNAWSGLRSAHSAFCSLDWGRHEFFGAWWWHLGHRRNPCIKPPVHKNFAEGEGWANCVTFDSVLELGTTYLLSYERCSKFSCRPLRSFEWMKSTSSSTLSLSRGWNAYSVLQMTICALSDQRIVDCCEECAEISFSVVRSPNCSNVFICTFPCDDWRCW